jgi:hypothetical protein
MALMSLTRRAKMPRKRYKAEEIVAKLGLRGSFWAYPFFPNNRADTSLFYKMDESKYRGVGIRWTTA